MNIQGIEITQITTNGDTESRPLNQQVVSEYVEAYKADPAKLPPLDAFFDGEHYWLGDGFHRLAAAKLAGLESVQVNVHEGGRIEALKHSLGSNVEHGYRRTAEDKRYAVTKALREFPTDSSHMIADLCRVSHNFVNELRSTVLDDSSIQSAEQKRIGKDGKRRRMPRRQPAEEGGRQHGADDPAAIASEADQTPPAPAPEPHEETSPEGVTPEPQAEGFDVVMISLDNACLRVVAVATQAMADKPRCKSKVCSRLNILRAELEKLTKGRLPKKELKNVA
jgi:hypothetical protein